MRRARTLGTARPKGGVGGLKSSLDFQNYELEKMTAPTLISTEPRNPGRGVTGMLGERGGRQAAKRHEALSSG